MNEIAKVKKITFKNALEATLWLREQVQDQSALRKALALIRKEAELAGLDDARTKFNVDKEYWYRFGWENSLLGGKIYEKPKQ